MGSVHSATDLDLLERVLRSSVASGESLVSAARSIPMHACGGDRGLIATKSSIEIQQTWHHHHPFNRRATTGSEIGRMDDYEINSIFRSKSANAESSRTMNPGYLQPYSERTEK